jgi:hypothetical protein
MKNSFQVEEIPSSGNGKGHPNTNWTYMGFSDSYSFPDFKILTKISSLFLVIERDEFKYTTLTDRRLFNVKPLAVVKVKETKITMVFGHQHSSTVNGSII